MKVAIEQHKHAIIETLMGTLAKTARKLGCSVSRRSPWSRFERNALSIVWNGRNRRNLGPTLFCEHGWLPRWDYQISHKGINADSHIAPFEWDGMPLTNNQREEVAQYMEALRKGGTVSHEYMQTGAEAVDDLPDAFYLVPLQIEQDTNIQRHVPAKFRRMQAFLDSVTAADPPLPLVFKQHPADQKRMNRHLTLKLRRKCDVLRDHDQGNIHQILKSGRCKGIIALNSNVVHDGLIWEVPSIVLGRNIWPQRGAGPFLTRLPNDWNDLNEYFSDSINILAREAYIHYLTRHQWTLKDAQNKDKVEQLFASVLHIGSPTNNSRGTTRRKTKAIEINLVAQNRGWLFEDIKTHFLNLETKSVRVTTSERPRTIADAWIYLRAQEVASTPNPAATLVQIHDLFDDGLYRNGGKRAAVAKCAAVTLTNQDQRRILESNGIKLDNKMVICRPIGPHKSFVLRRVISNKFTIGWVGRPVVHNGEDFKRVELLVNALRIINCRQSQLKVVLLGEHLCKIHHDIASLGIDCEYLNRSSNPFDTYPKHYQQFDCVVISSKIAAGPNCLYEALASGVPVISTSVGWSKVLVQNGINGYLFDTIEELTDAIEKIRLNREEWFANRELIRKSIQNYSMESWLKENLVVARKIGSLKKTGKAA